MWPLLLKMTVKISVTLTFQRLFTCSEIHNSNVLFIIICKTLLQYYSLHFSGVKLEKAEFTTFVNSKPEEYVKLKTALTIRRHFYGFV